jgi:hypothetical protein
MKDSAQKLAEDLDGTFALKVALPEACRYAEERIEAGIPGVIRETVDADEVKSDAAPAAPRFLFGDTVYESRTGQAPSAPDTLLVAMGEAGARWPKANFVQVQTEIRGSGLYTSVVVEADSRLRPIVESVSKAIQTYVEDGYRRLEAHAVGELLAIEHRVAIDLYMEIRSAVDTPAASHVGLYGLLDDGRAMYLLDPLAIQEALKQLNSERLTVSASPVALASVLVKGWVKTDDTIAKKALGVDQPIEFRLQDLRYTTTPGFDVAEGGLYGATELICQPLVRDGSVRLIAAYPIVLRDLVEKRLDALRPRLAQILADRGAMTKRLIRGDAGSPDRRWSIDRFAELLGRFAGGFTESLR